MVQRIFRICRYLGKRTKEKEIETNFGANVPKNKFDRYIWTDIEESFDDQDRARSPKGSGLALFSSMGKF